MPPETSTKEKRIKSIIQIYYSKPEVQKAIVDFCKNRETVPRYFEGFGKRPDVLDYPGDVFELVKKGATSFHCSQEIWKDPLDISTSMNPEQYNEIRAGWDLLIDIDSKYLDYSKVMAQLIIKVLKFHGIKNVGCKFSGSKGFHIIVPSKAFPKKVYGNKTKDMFPEWPKIITKYLIETMHKDLVKEISQLERPNKYVRDVAASQEVIPDLILVSSRHLFRAPYSLHEKTALASVVIDSEKISEFDVKDANPLNVKIKNFLSDVKEGEASELLMQALDWYEQEGKKDTDSNKAKIQGDYKPIKLEKLSDSHFPPSIRKILEGIADGRKRAVFILLGLFRAIGMEKDELEKRIYDWNKKNKPPLKEGYIKSQISWSYRNKIVPPPNFDKDYYKGIGVEPNEEELRAKNPVNYVVRKNRAETKSKTKNKNNS